MICYHCGKENHAGAAFCIYCGEKLEEPAAHGVPAAFCTACGAALEAGSAFCMMCGAQQILDTSYDSNATKEQWDAYASEPTIAPSPTYAPAPTYAPSTAYAPAPTYAPVARKIELTPDRSAVNPEIYHARPAEPPKQLHSAFSRASDLPAMTPTPAPVPVAEEPAVIPEAAPMIEEPEVIPAPTQMAEEPAAIPEAAPMVEEPEIIPAPTQLVEEPVVIPEAVPVVEEPVAIPAPTQVAEEPMLASEMEALFTAPAAPEQTMAFCTTCGARIPAADLHCTACGALQELDDEETVFMPAAERFSPAPMAAPIRSTSCVPAGKTKKRSSQWIVVLISILAGVVVLATAAWFAVPAITGDTWPEIFGMEQDAEEEDEEDDKDSKKDKGAALF